jgi:ABC-type phosphate transport system substrate-binding protein
MLRRNIKVGLAATLVASALPLILAGSAHADYAPQPSDVVGVGGDTPQYAASFLADGDYNGDAGFNSSSPVNRLVTFNATADANGRSTYAKGSTTVQLNPTVVLRAGTFPVQRISSSGNAISALLADTSVPETLNFVFSSSLPSPAQQTQAGTQGWGSLHVVEIGTDAVQIAADTTTNAPSGLSIQELLSIYTGTITKWNQLPGNSGGSGDTIIPLIPPSSSAIYKTFIASLTTANGNVAPTLSGSVQTVEQNDPTAITGASTPADAIVPFSLARLNLWNDGYFHNPNTAFPGSGTALTPGVSLLSGAPGDSNPVYSAGVTDYIIYRQSDQTSTTPFEPGGTRNFVQTLFSNPGGTTPFVESNTGRALIASSGVTPVYNDLGAAHT